MSESGHDDAGQAMALASGYSVESPDRARLLQIRAPDGRICLRITLLPTGPMVELSAASLAIAAEGDVRVDCQRLEIDAAKGVAIRSGGDITQVAGGNVELRAEGELSAEAFAQRFEARRGDIQMEANDDIFLDGERVRLNSPRTPAEEEKRKRLLAAGRDNPPALPKEPGAAEGAGP
jgi:hypothetical protein